MASVPDVKEAIVTLLDRTLPSDVRVLYAYPQDAKGRKVILGSVTTRYNSARMRAASSLLRYDLVYMVDIECYSGPQLRSPQIAEQVAYGLLDEVLTPLVRGDANGRTRLAETLPSVAEVQPSTDNRMVSWDDNDDREVVVGLTVEITIRRE